MGQLIAIDFGKSRCGIAATDDLQIIASGLPTVDTGKLLSFLEDYFSKNTVEGIVIGQPVDLKGNLSEVEHDILLMIEKLKVKFPYAEIYRYDERFTSKMASYFISQSGKNKKKREEKGLIDKVSATLILQNFLDNKQSR